MDVLISFIIIIFPVVFTTILMIYIYSKYARYEITANKLKIIRSIWKKHQKRINNKRWYKNN